MFYELEQRAHGPFFRMLDVENHNEPYYDAPPIFPGMPMSPGLTTLREGMEAAIKELFL